jgi:uncharacterized membrane protein
MMERIHLILILGLLALSGCTGQEASVVASDGGGATGSGASSDTVVIPVSSVTETVLHYEYDVSGTKVRYFAVKGSDGVVRTAFDACEVCYRADKGYSQVGSDVLCNNCGLRFKIDGLGTKNKGSGCWPAYLPNEVNGDQVVIKKSDLEAGAYLFGG